jgi:CMP-N-acetylneuraminic acid synthetase
VKEIDAVIINTDARDILIKNGLVESDRVIIRQRPAVICGDNVSMNFVIADDVENVKADIYLMTHTTNPLLSCETITLVLEKFKAHQERGTADSLFTVNKVQTRFYREDGAAINHDPENLMPTQNLEPWYEENSNLYLFTSESFAKTRARIGLNPAMHVTPLQESVDIDTPQDWDIGIATTQYLLDVGLIER